MISLPTWSVALMAIGAVLLLAGVLLLTLRLLRLASQYHQLQEEAAHLHLLLDHIPVPIWLHQEEKGLTYASPYYAQAMESTQEDILEQQLWLTKQSPRYQLPDGVKSRHHYEHCIIKGRRKWLQVHDIKLDDGWMSVGLDFTSLEAKQRELEEFNDFANDLVASSTNAIAIFDSNKQLQRYNQAYAVMWQLPQNFLDSKPTLTEILERQRQSRALPEQINFREFRKSINGLFENIIETHEEFYYLPDNRTIKLIVIPHAMGGLLFSYEDLTEKIALEQSYHTLSSINTLTLDALEEAIVVLGENGRVQLTNPSYRSMWGLTPDYIATAPHITDILEHAKAHILHKDEDWEARKQMVLHLINNRQASSQMIALPNGHVYRRTTQPLPDGAFLMGFLDITDSYHVQESLQKEKEAMQRADAIRTKFLDNVSYELRSPLTSIKGFAELLLQGYLGALNDKQTEYLRDMLSASNRLNKIIDNVIDATNIDAGFMVLNPENFTLRPMISETITSVESEIQEKELTIHQHCDSSLIIHADHQRLKQVLVNLLHNAITHEHSGGTISITAQQKASHIMLQVKDTGRGMPIETQQNLFDKFQATHHDGIMTGFGLSLSLAKSFVELHDGNMEIESRENVGTIITCYLPQPEEPVAPDNEAQEHAA